MAEPLDPLTQERIKRTLAMASKPRRVDQPAVGPDTRVGTLHIRARPVEKKHTHTCQHCGAGFTPPDNRNHKYCRDGCYVDYWHEHGRSRQAYKRMHDRAKRRAALGDSSDAR